MRRIFDIGWLTILMCIVFHENMLSQQWKIYSSFTTHSQAVKIDSKIFAVSDGALFSFDNDDQQVKVYDKTLVLSDYGIHSIAKYGSNLVVLYSNGNIDILSQNGSVYNMPELKAKAVDGITFNQLRIFGREAVISSSSGLIIVNLSKKTFSTKYDLGTPVLGCIIQNGRIYAKTKDSVFEGDRSDNLLDFSNWNELSPAEAKKTVDFDAYDKKESSENESNLKQVANIHPQGPEKNFSYRMHFEGEKLMIAGGCFNYPQLNRTGTVMTYLNGVWTSFERTGAQNANPKPEFYQNVTDVVQDPSDASHHFVSAACSGLYEFRDGKFVKHYTYGKNSPLTSILPTIPNAGYYVRITGLSYDSNGNLWMLNNECDTIVRIMTKDGRWLSYYYPEIARYQTFDQVLFDQRGWAWINSRRSESEGSQAGLLIINTNKTIDNKADDKHVFIKSVVNQNGVSYTDKVSLMNCIVEDRDGAIWVGTNQGPFTIQSPTSVFGNDFRYHQVIVPRNDGSGLGDYLLNEVAIKCIAVDGGNRKWFGTSSNGVYLTSADGTEIISHFTKDNSPLISDEIYSIAIDGRTGEVFIGTSQGICSYMGEATEPAEQYDEDKIIVYPNPVRPDYSGDIKITGLQYDSHVSIVNSAGRLVSKGKSVGGSYVWNGRTDGGDEAQSGVYFVLATDAEGKESVAGKFVIIR